MKTRILILIIITVLFFIGYLFLDKLIKRDLYQPLSAVGVQDDEGVQNLHSVANVTTKQNLSDRFISSVSPTSASTTNAVDVLAKHDTDAIANDHIFSFYDKHDQEAFMKLAESMGATVKGSMELGHIVLINVKNDAQLKQILEAGPVPVDASLNFRVSLPKEPDSVPRKPESGYSGFGTASLEWMGVKGDNSSWGKGVTVAVLDTGVGFHESLTGANITRIDLLNGMDNGVDDVSGHGTAVTSLIVGNSEDVSGLAPSADILSIRVLSSDGSGDAFTLARGIVEAVNRGANIINLSLGSFEKSFILQNAVDYASQRGVVIVAASGNDGIDRVSYPAAYDEVTAVSAVDATGRSLYFSNRGEEVDISAPGLWVNAAWPSVASKYFTGTSASVPFVSGALASIMSQNKELTGKEALSILMQYTDDAGKPGRDDVFGAGILDMGRAVDRNIPGIYDISAASPYLMTQDPVSGTTKVTLYFQNRGTEPIESATMNLVVDGKVSQIKLKSMPVGATAGHNVSLNAKDLNGANGVSIRYYATIDGHNDGNLSDNGRKIVVKKKDAGIQN